MVITMKDYDEIRKRYLAGESQRKIAKSLGISRNTVAKYCEGAAVPWARKTPERVSTVHTEWSLEDGGRGPFSQVHLICFSSHILFATSSSDSY